MLIWYLVIFPSEPTPVRESDQYNANTQCAFGQLYLRFCCGCSANQLCYSCLFWQNYTGRYRLSVQELSLTGSLET
jgi:hypothetical protein